MDSSFDDEDWMEHTPTPVPPLSKIAHSLAAWGNFIETTLKAHLNDVLATLPADRRHSVEAVIWGFGEALRTLASEMEESIEQLREPPTRKS